MGGTSRESRPPLSVEWHRLAGWCQQAMPSFCPPSPGLLFVSLWLPSRPSRPSGPRAALVSRPCSPTPHMPALMPFPPRPPLNRIRFPPHPAALPPPVLASPGPSPSLRRSRGPTLPPTAAPTAIRRHSRCGPGGACCVPVGPCRKQRYPPPTLPPKPALPFAPLPSPFPLGRSSSTSPCPRASSPPPSTSPPSPASPAWAPMPAAPPTRGAPSTRTASRSARACPRPNGTLARAATSPASTAHSPGRSSSTSSWTIPTCR